jgi:tetratricopeptide (TPR) repeat protein
MPSRFLLFGLILGIYQFGFSQQAIDSIWSENQDSLERATQSIQLGKGLRDTNLSLARNYNQQAVRILEKLGLDSLKAVALAELGVTYSYLAEYNKAFQANFAAIDLASTYGDTITLIDASKNIGIDYYYTNERDKAASYFETVANLTRKFGDTLRLANSFNNLGLIAAERGDIDQE